MKYIIGLSGYARSGKDTVAGIIESQWGFQRIAFADALRDSLYALNPTVVLEDGAENGEAWDSRFTPMELRDVIDDVGWEEAKRVTPEVRGLLQRMGTEVGRNMFGYNFWVDYTFNKIMQSHEENWVISDVRFPNEAEAVIDHGGFVWRIERPGFGPANSHISEVAVDDWAFDGRLYNTDGLDELAEVTNDLVRHFGMVLSS